MRHQSHNIKQFFVFIYSILYFIGFERSDETCRNIFLYYWKRFLNFVRIKHHANIIFDARERPFAVDSFMSWSVLFLSKQKIRCSNVCLILITTWYSIDSLLTTETFQWIGGHSDVVIRLFGKFRSAGRGAYKKMGRRIFDGFIFVLVVTEKNNWKVWSIFRNCLIYSVREKKNGETYRGRKW